MQNSHSLLLSILSMFCLLQKLYQLVLQKVPILIQVPTSCPPVDIGASCEFQGHNVVLVTPLKKFDGKDEPFYCLNIKFGFASPLLFSGCYRMISPRHLLHLSISYLLYISPKLPHLSPREKMHQPKIAGAKSSAPFSGTFVAPFVSSQSVDNFDFQELIFWYIFNLPSSVSVMFTVFGSEMLWDVSRPGETKRFCIYNIKHSFLF